MGKNNPLLSCKTKSGRDDWNSAPIEMTDRSNLKYLLLLPADTCHLSPEFRGKYIQDGIVMERWIWQSEPGSWVTSVLYYPKNHAKPILGIVITNGPANSDICIGSMYIIKGLNTWIWMLLPSLRRSFDV